MIRGSSLFLLLVSAGLLSSTALSQQTPAYLQGVIVEAGSNAPIGKATVELRGSTGSGPAITTTRTDSEGKFYCVQLDGCPGWRAPNRDHSIRILDPGRTEDQRIDDAENSRVRTDRQR